MEVQSEVHRLPGKRPRARCRWRMVFPLALLAAGCGTNTGPTSNEWHVDVSRTEVGTLSVVPTEAGGENAVATTVGGREFISVQTVVEVPAISTGPEVPRCVSSQLTALKGASDAAMGPVWVEMEVRNVSTTGCSVAAVNTILARKDLRDVVLPMVQPQDVWPLAEDYELSTVLGPGQSAFALFGWYNHACGSDLPFDVFSSMDLDLGEGGLLRLPDDDLFGDQACDLHVSKLVTASLLL